MIGRLRGRIISKQPPMLLIEVGGVGYEVEAPMSTFYQLPETDEEVLLHTHLIVREDAQLLCGFASEAERQLFRSLIKTNGVGAKLALAILSGMSAVEFSRCIHEEDSVTLVRLPGVGRKTAERLIIEMRDRLPKTEDSAVLGMPKGSTTVGADKEARHALEALGYKPAEAQRMVQKATADGLNSEEIIRAALKAAVSR
ncbi:Holliday junction ATP-dependent DNA helicase RuvA [hydrothermal vent metagenome]|uniref:Holliday junction ATP-dependent DNA helicase RuvA n=1 Tax=hydrothermal vent metagenome TaxID=652676 RepID=A0A3B1BPT4_9ZZZZ